jgi:hypothetical protein
MIAAQLWAEAVAVGGSEIVYEASRLSTPGNRPLGRAVGQGGNRR